MSKEVLIDAIRGLDGPYYTIMDKYEKLGLGKYYGGMLDSWKWNSRSTIQDKLKDFTEEELTSFYKEIINSWK